MLAGTLLYTQKAAALSDAAMCDLLKTHLGEKAERYNYLYKNRIFCRSGFWRHANVKTIDEIFSKQELGQYNQLLSENKCEASAFFLSSPFARAHPQIPSILTNKEDYAHWIKETIPYNYSNLALCFLTKKIRSAQFKIDNQSLNAAPFMGRNKSLQGSYFKNAPLIVRQRNLAFFKLIILSRRFPTPKIQFTLLRFSQEDKIVKFHPEYKYFLALKLHKSGMQHELITKYLMLPLTKERREHIEQAAKRNVQHIPPKFIN